MQSRQKHVFVSFYWLVVHCNTMPYGPVLGTSVIEVKLKTLNESFLFLVFQKPFTLPFQQPWRLCCFFSSNYVTLHIIKTTYLYRHRLDWWGTRASNLFAARLWFRKTLRLRLLTVPSASWQSMALESQLVMSTIRFL